MYGAGVEVSIPPAAMPLVPLKTQQARPVIYTSALMSSTRRTRVFMACTHCRRRKIRCKTDDTGLHPCERCVRKGYTCSYVAVGDEGTYAPPQQAAAAQSQTQSHLNSRPPVPPASTFYGHPNIPQLSMSAQSTFNNHPIAPHPYFLQSPNPPTYPIRGVDWHGYPQLNTNNFVPHGSGAQPVQSFSRRHYRTILPRGAENSGAAHEDHRVPAARQELSRQDPSFSAPIASSSTWDLNAQLTPQTVTMGMGPVIPASLCICRPDLPCFCGARYRGG
ncbi:hypothetical protein FB45DRAFT_1086356 [Roridomyces roridus]|uniref:Zn(2)-C6 fungal-type domain-containing protein n=1 Tax=Roridomyces roridus TaxID=1738132 RepID=A0AAD7BLA1_9AGAR|nr:hypothetical protein FB45DRAFT_1086356 [Roridomyces roridus]